jgi:hypothetical protein
MITLLNGDVWEEDQLLEHMFDDEFYYGYCSKAMFSSSKVKTMAKSPKSYYYIDKYQTNQQPLRDGWLFHAAILEPHVFDAQVFAKTLTKGVAFKELEKVHGKGNVYSQKEKQDAERLARAFTVNQKAMGALRNSNFEVPMFGVIDDIPFRGKADIITDTGKIIDLKTCQNISNFRKDAYAIGYDVQTYIYGQLWGKSYEDFEFIAIDKKSLDIGFYKCSKEFWESGKMKVQNVLSAYKNNIQGKDTQDVAEFINNYYFEDTL